MVNLLANYHKYFRKEGNAKFEKKKGINKYYDVHELIKNSHHFSKSSFYRKFVETSLFTVLIEKKKL